ncbi:MAG: NAD-dependent epimerase/dehydratase family protein, partial [Candidatus Kerfeldbacteria bacterium]|nr:NAD-dependent epimerase/dehydratase family protein [Candidatus Kerfeldbacteria bacterium]
MIALVTGARGFTGRHLSEYLRQYGHTVVALVRDCDYREVASPTEQSKTIYVRGDLTNLDLLYRT